MLCSAAQLIDLFIYSSFGRVPWRLSGFLRFVLELRDTPTSFWAPDGPLGGHTCEASMTRSVSEKPLCASTPTPAHTCARLRPTHKNVLPMDRARAHAAAYPRMLIVMVVRAAVMPSGVPRVRSGDVRWETPARGLGARGDWAAPSMHGRTSGEHCCSGVVTHAGHGGIFVCMGAGAVCGALLKVSAAIPGLGEICSALSFYR